MLSILHHDERFVVVDKPSGLAVHPGWADDDRTALHEVRDTLGQKVFPVHRLDRATSGVLVFALASESARVFCEMFEEGRVEKHYLALVRGVAPEAGTIDHPIPRREGGPRVPASTSFRRVWRGEHLSLVDAEPHSGRLHQVRRHMKHISHPLIGDANYGKGALNRAYRERFGLARLALHARSLGFVHPWEGKPITFEAALPEDLRAPFERIGVVI
ncbi:MAG TPA: pseudouridine synthase [Polyangium sp.]|nr:pseudouridine synthase [Polyangium sp.]